MPGAGAVILPLGCKSPRAPFPRPLWAGVGGGVWRRQARIESDIRDLSASTLWRAPARGPRPQPPPTRGGGMQQGKSDDISGSERIMAKQLHHWINGKLTEGTSGRFGDV